MQANEILVSITVPVTGKAVAYAKYAQKASGFAIVGVAVRADGGAVAVGITGVGTKAYRAAGVEKALSGQPLKTESIASAARHAAEGVDALGDIHASAEFRAHLAGGYSKLALELAASR